MEKAISIAHQIMNFENYKNFLEDFIDEFSWSVCKIFYLFLEVSNDSTNLLSGFYYNTISLVLDILLQIFKTFNK